jgi:hypothetical protein
MSAAATVEGGWDPLVCNFTVGGERSWRTGGEEQDVRSGEGEAAALEYEPRERGALWQLRRWKEGDTLSVEGGNAARGPTPTT